MPNYDKQPGSEKMFLYSPIEHQNSDTGQKKISTVYHFLEGGCRGQTKNMIEVEESILLAMGMTFCKSCKRIHDRQERLLEMEAAVPRDTLSRWAEEMFEGCEIRVLWHPPVEGLEKPRSPMVIWSTKDREDA